MTEREEAIQTVLQGTPELVCECGAEINDDGEGLELKNVEYEDDATITYHYECLECGKTVKEIFYRVKVEVSDI